MSLGDLRSFLASIDGIPDDAPIKARVTLRKRLRALTVEDEDTGLQDYLRSIGPAIDLDARDKETVTAD
jgi:hypothetical protein